MKKKLLSILIGLVLLLAFTSTIVIASPTFTEIELNDSFVQPKAFYSVDIDDDGDYDIVGAGKDSSKIVWWNNTDGKGEVWTEHDIDTTCYGAYDVYAVDMDKDNDIDVISCSFSTGEIFWYENDGSESFTRHVIFDASSYALSIYAIDINEDTEMDVVASYSHDGGSNVSWFENDGSESFSEHVLGNNISSCYTVHSVDIDDDGDDDVFATSSSGDRVVWYENDGSESFTFHELATSYDGAGFVTTFDVDQDGILDVITSGMGGGDVSWWKHDGVGGFSRNIVHGLEGAREVFACDYDDDRDVDLVACSQGNSTVVLYENNGNQQFGVQVIKSSFSVPFAIHGADFDSDDDFDFVTGAYSGNEVILLKTDGLPHGDTIEVTLTPSETVDIAVNFGSWTPSSGLNESNVTSMDYFNVENVGNVNVDIEINASDTVSWTLTTSPGHDMFNMSFTIGSGYTLLTTSMQSFTDDLVPGTNQSFGLKVYMPETSSTTQNQITIITLQASAVGGET